MLKTKEYNYTTQSGFRRNFRAIVSNHFTAKQNKYNIDKTNRLLEVKNSFRQGKTIWQTVLVN